MSSLSRKSRPVRRKKVVLKRMYVLVRRDLAETYRCVQGGHALTQYSMDYPEDFSQWNNTTLLYLGVRNLNELREWIYKLKMRKKVFSVFFEPDLDGHPTAVACYDSGVIFKKLYLV
jgi:hypothetical protein